MFLIWGGGCSSTFPPHQITSITRRYCIASIEPFCDCILLAKTHLVPISVRTHLLHRCLLCTVLCTRKYKWKRPEFHRFCRTSLHNLKKERKKNKSQFTTQTKACPALYSRQRLQSWTLANVKEIHQRHFAIDQNLKT